MKVLKIIGLGLIVASLSACSASVSVDEDAVAAAGGSGGSSLSIDELDGGVFYSECRDSDGPPSIHYFMFNGANIYEYEEMYFEQDCNSVGLQSEVALLGISVFSLGGVEIDGDDVLVQVTHVISTLTPMTDDGVSAANDMTTIGESGTLCGLTGWTEAVGQDVSGINSGQGTDPCFDKPAANVTRYGKFTINQNGSITPYEWETSAQLVVNSLNAEYSEIQ